MNNGFAGAWQSEVHDALRSWREEFTRTAANQRPVLGILLALAAFLVTFGPAVVSAWYLLLSPVSRSGASSSSTQEVVDGLGMAATLLLLGAGLLQAARRFTLKGGLSLRDFVPGWPARWAMSIATFYVPLVGGSLLILALLDHLGAPSINTTASGETLGTDLVAAVLAGVGEEVFVLALPVAAMRAAHVRPWVIITAAVALRMSYHVYYGWYALALLPWALGVTWAFWRWSCLLPLILVHTAYDSWAALADHSAVAWWPVIVISLILLSVLLLVAGPIRARGNRPGRGRQPR